MHEILQVVMTLMIFILTSSNCQTNQFLVLRTVITIQFKITAHANFNPDHSSRKKKIVISKFTVKFSIIKVLETLLQVNHNISFYEISLSMKTILYYSDFSSSRMTVEIYCLTVYFGGSFATRQIHRSGEI